MLKICEENRLELENSYLALLLNKPDLFSIAQIKIEYLHDVRNKKIFKYAKECFDEHECLNIVEIYKKHIDFDVDYFHELYKETLYCHNAWKAQLQLSEESIIKFYKQDVIDKLHEKLTKREMTYDDFMKKMKKLDDIVLTNNSVTLNSAEILQGINVNNSKINLNCFPKLNKYLGLVQGDFLIIGAKTGSGKSGFMLNLMNDLMNTFQCIYFNMEMSKSTIYKRIVAINANIFIDDIDNPKSDYQKKVIDYSIKKIESANLIVEHKASDIKEIKSIVMRHKDKDKHTILFIDHLGLTKCDSQRSLYEQATEVAKQLRQMCLEYDCTIISASQLNRTAYSSNEVTLSMLKDSGELENSASKVILLNNKINEQNSTVDVDIDIAKNRDGICGTIAMQYDKSKQIFKEI